MIGWLDYILFFIYYLVSRMWRGIKERKKSDFINNYFIVIFYFCITRYFLHIMEAKNWHNNYDFIKFIHGSKFKHFLQFKNFWFFYTLTADFIFYFIPSQLVLFFFYIFSCNYKWIFYNLISQVVFNRRRQGSYPASQSSRLVG